MKKITIVFCMWLSMVSSMLAESLTVQTLTIGAGETGLLSIGLQNETITPTAWQLVITLPEGIDMAQKNDGYDCVLSDRHDADSHTLTVVKQSAGRYMLVCYSAGNVELSGNKGNIVQIGLKADVALKGKTVECKATEMLLSDIHGVKTSVPDVSSQVQVVYPVIHVQSVNRVYGEPNPEFSFTVSGAELRGVPQLKTMADASSPVGNYVIAADKGTIENAYYEVEEGTMTVTKASLTIMAEDKTKKQGEAMPKLTVSYSGFQNDETSSVLSRQPVVSCDATESSSPGTYVIQVADAEAQNYDISYVNGQLVVTEADPMTITAKSYSRKYGEANPVFEYEVEGGALEGKPEISCDATVTSPVGTYDIVVKKGSVANYNVTYVIGKLTIEKTPLAIKARTYTKKQGEAMPAFTLDYEGFKNNETEKVLKNRPVVTCEANEESEPGEYPVVVSGAEAQNYDISYVNGQLVVTEADPVTITAKSYTREYGDANPTFGYEVEGAPLHGVPSITCEALSTSPVGVYPIVITKGSVKNYNDQYVGGTLTITPATLTVSVGNYSREEGQENPTFTLLYEGWKNGENETVLLAEPVATTAATKDSPAGEYAITVSGGEAQNYTFNYINGVLAVTEQSGIDDLLISEQPFDVYSVTGKMIRHQTTTLKGLPRGVYVICGQKVIVR